MSEPQKAAPHEVAAARIAAAAVSWDGLNEDGCPFCEGEPIGDTAFVAHAAADCPVEVYRLHLIRELIAKDPTPESKEGKRLKVLAAAQHASETARADRSVV